MRATHVVALLSAAVSAQPILPVELEFYGEAG